MGISPLTTYQNSSSRSAALQALLAQYQKGSNTQTAATSSAGDNLSLNPMAQYLSKAPGNIAGPLKDLMTSREDVTADLKALQTYFAAHPEERTRFEAAMQLQGANPPQGIAMQAGVLDLKALTSQMDEASGTPPSKEKLGKAILALLQHQGSSINTGKGADLTGSDTPDKYSLFSYLT